MNPLERTESTALCKRCGHLHWNQGDVCGECLREANVGNRIVCGLVIWTGLCIALGVLFATSCFGSDNFSTLQVATGEVVSSSGGAVVQVPGRAPFSGRRTLEGRNAPQITCHAAPTTALVTAGRDSLVTPQLLDSIAWRESRNNPRAVGKAGEMGAYQIRAIAVREVNRVHGTRYRHSDAVAQGRELARRYLIITDRNLTRILRRNPTAEELYQGYRYGVRGFTKQFRTGHVREAVPGASRVERSYAAKISTGPGCGANLK